MPNVHLSVGLPFQASAGPSQISTRRTAAATQPGSSPARDPSTLLLLGTWVLGEGVCHSRACTLNIGKVTVGQGQGHIQSQMKVFGLN